MAPETQPLLHVSDELGAIVLRITDPSGQFSRIVTPDLGPTEPAVRVALHNTSSLRFWLGLHERWQGKSRHKVTFRECGVRLYLGAIDEDAVQVLRLEWVAPTRDPDGLDVFPGKHAGHPHWHVDRGALVGNDDYIRSLELLTAPERESDVEHFGSDSATVSARVLHDCSWIPRIHLPAHAGWMNTEWDAHTVPGPHQSEPGSIEDLSRWWAGALRYLKSELAKAAS